MSGPFNLRADSCVNYNIEKVVEPAKAIDTVNKGVTVR